MNNKELVLTAITDVFNKRDMKAFDKYFGDNYIQHNPNIPNGIDAVKQFVSSLPENFKYDTGIVTENDNMVMIHGRLNNLYGKNMIVVDIFKVENGKLVEHWDIMQEEVTAENSANGNAMFPAK